MAVRSRLDTRYLIIGAGFAGAATAWALARAGLGPGLIVERERMPGAHASGRNAAMAHQTERDPVILSLVLRSMQHIRMLDVGRVALIAPTGGLTVATGPSSFELVADHVEFRGAGLPTCLLSPHAARHRFDFLERVALDVALWSPSDGVLDVHALLTRYLDLARRAGFALLTGCDVQDLIVDAGRLVRGGLAADRELRAEVVIDASGAWAGRLGRRRAALPLRPLRRHLFVTGPLAFVRRGWPFTWMRGDPFYFRPEGEGLLLSPCDETPWPPSVPPVDPAAAELLAGKLTRLAPGLADLPVRRSWACLRTFAPDRRPIVGWDPSWRGLFHVSALGGFGATGSAAVGELAATLLDGHRPSWIDPSLVAPARLLTTPAA